MPTADRPDRPMSPGEYQYLTLLEAVGDDLVVNGVVYSRDAWEPDPEDGVRRRTTDTDTAAPGDRAPRRTKDTATERSSSDLPF